MQSRISRVHVCGSLSLSPALLADAAAPALLAENAAPALLAEDTAPALLAEEAAPEDVPLVEFMYLDTLLPDESYRKRLRYSLLYLRYVFRALINSLAMVHKDHKDY